MQTRRPLTRVAVLGLLTSFPFTYTPAFAASSQSVSVVAPAPTGTAPVEAGTPGGVPGIAAQIAPGAGGSDGKSQELTDARLFAEVMQRVREDYVTPVDSHKLMMAAIRGMVESLDTHSTFLTGDEFQDMQVTTSGAYAGIGVEVVPGKDGVKVVRRIPQSPAERAGIHAGDVIVKIDDLAVSPTDVDAAIERMRGTDGSVIALAVRRDGSPSLLQFNIRRAQVKLVSVESELLSPDYGYLRITSFTDSTAEEVEAAIKHLEHAGHHRLKGLIIDLRNNPGGVLDSAVRVADDFLDNGTIVSAQGRTEDANFRFNATPGDITHGARLIVVVNGGSASAAEILAAALHDNKRAELIGRRTYGKGTVQTIMPLHDGMALKITTSRYFTPAGVCINGVGIIPDVQLKGPEQLPADLDTADAYSHVVTPTLPARDQQVAMALDLLSGHPGPVLGQAATAELSR